MALGDGVRRNIATVSQAERDRLRDAFLKLDAAPNLYPDGVTFWDKQEEIHKQAHAAGQDVHGGPAFLAWHRELVRRLELLIRGVDPQLSLHYWDWTTDPRSSPDGAGGVVNLFTDQFMGAASGDIGAPFPDFESTEGGGHTKVWRNVNNGLAGAPTVQSDAAIIAVGNAQPKEQQWRAFRNALENAHNTAHGYIGGTLQIQHFSFHDPFVFLLHSNVDRLWACWQLVPGKSWRLDPAHVYGDETADPSITSSLEPWAGQAPPLLRPWASPDNQQEIRTPTDPTVISPPSYDNYGLALVVPDVTKWTSIIRILFGITNDAPGIAVGPNGQPIPVDPWGPLFDRLAPEKRNILVGMAVTELGPLLSGAAHAQMTEVGLKIIETAVQDLKRINENTRGAAR